MKNERLKDIKCFMRYEEEVDFLQYEVCYKMRAGMKVFADKRTLEPTIAITYPDLNDGYLMFQWAYVVYYDKDKIYYAPRAFVKGEFLLVCDRRTGEYQYIELKQPKRFLDIEENQKKKDFVLGDSCRYHYINSLRFLQIYKYQEELFFVPTTYPGIVKLNTVTNELEYYSDFVEELLVSIEKKGGFTRAAFGRTARIKDTIYLTCRDCNMLLEFDMKSCRGRWILLGERDYGNLLVVKEQEVLHLFSVKGREVSSYNTKTGEIREWEFPCDYTESITLWKGSFFVPAKESFPKLYRIDAATKELLSIDELTHRMQPEEDVTCVCADEEALYVLTSCNRIYRYDGKQVYEKEIALTEDELLHLKKQKARYWSTDFSELEESTDFSLEDYVEKQIYDDFLSEKQQKEQLGNGALIFSTVMKDEKRL